MAAQLALFSKGSSNECVVDAGMIMPYIFCSSILGKLDLAAFVDAKLMVIPSGYSAPGKY